MISHSVERWDDTDQAQEAPFPAVVANSIAGYPGLLGLPGIVHLTGPTTPPEFNFAPDLDHPFAVEQREGVYPERRLEWLMQRAHRVAVPPNPLMQPTNAGDAGRRPRPALPAATKDHRLSQVVCS